MTAGKQKPAEVAYAQAFHSLVELLERHRVPHAHTEAHEWMRRLLAAGWRHRPPLETEPRSTGRPAAPVEVPEYVRAREALAAAQEEAVVDEA